MAKFVVAFRDRDTADKIASLLRESGYEVMRVCSSGDEVKRVFRTIQDGILIAGARLADRSLDEAVQDLNEHIEILCLCRPEQFSQVNTDRVFRQAMPVTKSVLNAWADMLAQLHYQRLPRRSETDKDLISRAKAKIMSEKNMDEREAHRYLQQLSMNLGLRMPEVAAKILGEERTT